jgi:hypothetical protein
MPYRALTFITSIIKLHIDSAALKPAPEASFADRNANALILATASKKKS